jgi:PilZ domain-containing protein
LTQNGTVFQFQRSVKESQTTIGENASEFSDCARACVHAAFGEPGASDAMANVETRQVERDSLLLIAQLRIDGGEAEYRVKVRNLSAGGMMGEGNAPVARGALVSIGLRNVGWVEGTVAWKQDDRFGIAFVEEIDPKEARAPIMAGAPDLASPRFTRPPLDSFSTNLRKI